MPELLTEDSRLLLAFIRDHPGVTRLDIDARLLLNKFDIAMAIKRLMYHGLIVRLQSHEGPDFDVRYYPG
ncbi:MAG TPA: hypothetical protein VJL54_04890 [Nitrososphaera sp.]|nr:hypothetical protein [Nitrososphaera sp.]